jgi:hypothetical protein
MENEDRKYVFGSLNDILIFAQWVNDNFKSPSEYEIWFDSSMDSLIPSDILCSRPPKSKKDMFKCDQCDAQFSTKAGLKIHSNVLHKRKEQNDKFWDIVRNSYDNNEDHNESDISDTD